MNKFKLVFWGIGTKERAKMASMLAQWKETI